MLTPSTLPETTTLPGTPTPALPGTPTPALPGTPTPALPGTATSALPDTTTSADATSPTAPPSPDPPSPNPPTSDPPSPDLPPSAAASPDAASTSPSKPDPGSDPDRLARLALNHAVEPADPLIGRLLTRHSPAEILAAIQADQLADLDPDPSRHERLVDRCAGLKLRLEPGQVESGIAAAAAVGARFIVPTDSDWPRQLDDLGELRPIGIWTVGRWPPIPPNAPAHAGDTSVPPNAPAHVDDMSVPSNAPAYAGDIAVPPDARVTTTDASVAMMSVVGARACTGYGAYIAGAIGADLASAQVAVVSGAALGIDAAAHRGALAVGGPTVAVLACGIDRVYPRIHEVLLRAIAGRGAVLSELPPGASPTRFRFLHRNRIIAALGAGTVVVEAARRSGSLVTARLAAELGRVVMAVPGAVTSEQSAGTHELIRDGAILVTGATQAREACASLTEASLMAREAGTNPTDASFMSREARPNRADASSAARARGRSGAAMSDVRPKQQRAPAEPADPVEELVVEALPGARALAGTDVLTLARATGLRPDVVFAALGRLAAAGRAIRAGGGWLLAPPE